MRRRCCCQRSRTCGRCGRSCERQGRVRARRTIPRPRAVPPPRGCACRAGTGSLEQFGGERGVLAHVNIPGPRVGRYGVDLATLERLATPALEQAGEHDFAISDELGKMKLASHPFQDALSALLDRPGPVVATVQRASHPFSDALKRRRDIETLRVTTAANRNELPKGLAARLRSAR